MDGLGRRTGGKGGKKEKGFEKEGGVGGGGERMPTTPPPPPQCCCDTRARVPPRERDVAERERERELHGEWKEDTEEEREKNWDPR